LQKALRPESILSFTEALKRNTSFPLPANLSIGATNFETFFEALLEYSNAFVFIFRFLSKNNEINVPEISARDGGIIRTFCAKIPFFYGNRVAQTLGKSSYDTLENFLEAFMAIAKNHRDISVKARDMMNHFVFGIDLHDRQDRYDRHDRHNGPSNGPKYAGSRPRMLGVVQNDTDHASQRPPEPPTEDPGSPRQDAEEEPSEEQQVYAVDQARRLPGPDPIKAI
jgi:hypothetical protein